MRRLFSVQRTSSTMRTFRIWWGPEAYFCHDYEAETAEDALIMARLNFARFGHTPYKMEAIEIKKVGEK